MTVELLGLAESESLTGGVGTVAAGVAVFASEGRSEYTRPLAMTSAAALMATRVRTLGAENGIGYFLAFFWGSVGLVTAFKVFPPITTSWFGADADRLGGFETR